MSFGLGRSNSLSINTGAGGSSLFGNTAGASQGQQSGGLFGTAGQTTTTTQPASGGLFGSTATPATSQPPSGGLFGNLSKPATSGTTGGGLFGGALAGASTTTPAASSTGGGLFGGLGGGQAQQQQAKPSLFGASTTQQTATTPSLFGGATNTQSSQAAPTPSLFGTTITTQQPQQTSSLFGGAMSTTANPTLAGGNQSAQSALQIKSIENIRGTTRFNDLHPDLQKLIQEVDDAFQKKMDFANQVTASLPGQDAKVRSLAPDVAYIVQLLETVELGLDNDIQSIARLKELVAHDEEEARLLDRVRANLALPQPWHYRSAGGALNINMSGSTAGKAATAAEEGDDAAKAVDLVGYFSRRADDMKTTLDQYQSHIREIEAHLRTMEAGTVEKAQQLTGNRSAMRDQKRELGEALRAIGGAISDTAVKVHKANDAVIQQTLGGVGAGLS